LLAAENNTRFLRGCVEDFHRVNFADQESGRIYLRMESGAPTLMDPVPLQAAIRDADTLAAVRAVAPDALAGEIAAAEGPQYLSRYDCKVATEGFNAVPTLGVWAETSGC
jgi:hypothetical protein